MPKTIYLAGPIAGCSDAENHDWRNTVKLALGGKYLFLDPTDRDYRGYDRHTGAGLMQVEDCTKLVEDDIVDIKKSDIVLAHTWKTSTGTSMEFVYARQFNKFILAICPNEYVSPWIQYHTDYVVRSLDQAIRFFAEVTFGG